MAGRKSRYKTTLFDRMGPDAEQVLRAWSYGFMAFGIAFGAALLAPLAGGGKPSFLIAVAAGAAFGLLAGGGSYAVSRFSGGTWKRIMVDGASTPYKEQYSLQQALVMQRRLDEALASYEAVIAGKPDDPDVRIRAAELYDREAKNHVRAAELFREALRLRGLTVGQDVYLSNRLADLYLGPLNDPGKALVALRRMVDRHPNSAAAGHARAAIAGIKERLHGNADSSGLR